MYALVDVKAFELDNAHAFTQLVGKTMFGTYSAIMIVVLLNMLIAMLSSSYQEISVSLEPPVKASHQTITPKHSNQT